MGLFNQRQTDDEGINKPDISKILGVVGGGISGIAGALEPEPEATDWTPIVVVAAVGIGFILLLSSDRRR